MPLALWLLYISVEFVCFIQDYIENLFIIVVDGKISVKSWLLPIVWLEVLGQVLHFFL